jgi:hypothetical protein
MPWAYPTNIPRVAKKWTPAEQRKCIKAGNAVLSGGGSEQDAIFACIRAAGKTKNPGGRGKSHMPDADRMVDLFAATRVLAGEEVCLVPVMPNGFHRGGVKKPPITEEDCAALVRNFENRGRSGFYQETIPLNREHDNVEGKIGSIKTLTLKNDGVYALFDLTPKGRQVLEEDSFDYLSPEIRWQTIDVVTGEKIGPTLAGAAVTNYPFFGGRTAMFSEAAYDKLKTDFPVESRMMAGMAGLIERLDRFGEWLDGLDSEEGGDSTDNNGNPDSDVSNSDDPEDSQQEDIMSENQMQIPEEFAEQMRSMEARLAELQARDEQYTAQLAERDTTIASQGQEIDRLALARVSDRFNRQAEDYRAIGADNGDLAEHLTWLFLVDETEDRAHFTFFDELLSTLDQTLAESDAFSQTGHEEEGRPSSALAQAEAAVAKRAKELGVEAPIGSEQYNEVLSQVLAEDPQLYQNYRAGIANAKA